MVNEIAILFFRFAKTQRNFGPRKKNEELKEKETDI